MDTPLESCTHSRTIAKHPPSLPPSPQHDLEDFLFPEPKALAAGLAAAMPGRRYTALNAAMGALLDEFSLVSFVPLDVTDEDRCEWWWVGARYVGVGAFGAGLADVWRHYRKAQARVDRQGAQQRGQ
jgi:hypothetical protein